MTKNKILKNNLSLYEESNNRKKIFFLFNQMEVSEKDKSLLAKWGFSFTDDFQDEKLKNKNSFGNDFNGENLSENFTNFSLLEKKFNDLSKNIIDNASKNQFIALDLSEILDNLIDNYSNYLKEFILYLNLSTDNSIENLTFLTACYSNLLAQKANHSKQFLAHLIYGSILCDIYFYHNNKEKINFELLKSKNSIDDLDFLKKHTIYAYNILREVQGLPEEYKLFGLLHHEKFDGSGYHKLKNEKIPLDMHYLSLVQDFIYPKHFFFNQFKKRKYSLSSLDILKNQQKYSPKILKNFIEIFGIYHLGEIMILNDKNDNTKSYVIILECPSIKEKPLVKVIVDNENKVDYSINLIDLNKSERFDLIDPYNQEIVKEFKELFFENIIENKFKVS